MIYLPSKSSLWCIDRFYAKIAGINLVWNKKLPYKNRKIEGNDNMEFNLNLVLKSAKYEHYNSDSFTLIYFIKF